MVHTTYSPGTEDSVIPPPSPEEAEDPGAAGWFSRLPSVSGLSWDAGSTTVSRIEAVPAPMGLTIWENRAGCRGQNGGSCLSPGPLAHRPYPVTNSQPLGDMSVRVLITEETAGQRR